MPIEKGKRNDTERAESRTETAAKAAYSYGSHGREGEGPSWGELADADTLVSDEELEAEFGGTEFVPDDFS